MYRTFEAIKITCSNESCLMMILMSLWSLVVLFSMMFVFVVWYFIRSVLFFISKITIGSSDSNNSNVN